MKMWLSIFGFLLIFKVSTAIWVGFSESDYAKQENAGPLKVVLTFTGQTNSEVTLEVVPMTISSYLNMTGSLPFGVQGKDPAESGLDFGSASHFVSINQSSILREVAIYIDIIDDMVSELEEVFLLHLRDVTDRSGVAVRSTVNFGRDVSFVRIIQPVSKRTKIRWSVRQLNFTEGDPEGENQLFIELDNPIEFTVFLKLRMQFSGMVTSKDLEIPETITVPANSSSRIPVPVHIKDDRVAEDVECIVIRLGFPTVPVYRIFGHSSVEICIKDNDVPRFGIRPRTTNDKEMVQSEPIELMEGDTMELCIVLLEPEDCTMYISGTVSLSPDAPTDVILFKEQMYYSLQLPCFEVTALNNSVINAPVTMIFDISTQIFYEFRLQPGGDHVLIEPGLLLIRDDDGVPIAPEQIDLQFEGSQVYVSWVANPSELQPIDKFVVVVEATPTRSSIRSRRQMQVPSLSPGEVWEYETTETDTVLALTDTSKSYTVSVCAVNTLGRICSSPQKIERPKSSHSPNAKPNPSAATAVGLSGRDLTSEKRKSLSFPVVITLAVMVPVMLLVLCLTVIIVVIMCKCCKGRRQEYCPAKQEKMSMQNVFVEAKYIKRELSTSSVSMEWTCGEPYNPRPGSSTPSKFPSNNSVVLGTPV